MAHSTKSPDNTNIHPVHHLSTVLPDMAANSLNRPSLTNLVSPITRCRGTSRASPTVVPGACSLIGPASELIARGVALLLHADQASCTNDVISRAKHSMKRPGQRSGRPPTGIHGNRRRQGGRDRVKE